MAGVATPRLIFATSAGSIGVVAELDAASSKLLSDLERNMRRVVEGVGGLKQEQRARFLFLSRIRRELTALFVQLEGVQVGPTDPPTSGIRGRQLC
jgi:hypothetical protein